jgi:cyclomaltodextrinase
MAENAELVTGSASAPGDLPLQAVKARLQALGNQFRHDNTLAPMEPTAADPVVVSATAGISMGVESATLHYTVDGSAPDGDALECSMELVDTTWGVESGYVDRWQATIGPFPDGTAVRYRISGKTRAGDVRAHDGGGLWFREGEAGLTTFAFSVRDERLRLPTWFHDAVTYQIFLDRFRRDDGWDDGLGPTVIHGGSLQGVASALPHLESLGVGCVWLSPVGPSPSYHRYDQTDFFAVDSRLGTMDHLRSLIEDVHSRGMRIILDFVPSHVSWLMPEFVAAQHDRSVPSFDWFVFDEWPHRYRRFLGIAPHLVSLNGSDPGLRRYLIDSAIHWVTEVGFDGFRLDHAIGHGSDFWVEFTSAVTAARPDAAIFGEVTDTLDMLRGYAGRIPGVLDFPLARLMRDVIARGRGDAADLIGGISAEGRYLNEGPDRVTFLDNHDINRFLFLAGEDTRRLALGLLCLLTLPYPPVIYYGTEIGLSQPQDKDAGGLAGDHLLRPDMPWNPSGWNHDVLRLVRDLIAVRTRHAATRSGRWRPLIAEGRVAAYRLVGDTVLDVYLNLAETPAEVPVGERRDMVLPVGEAGVDAGVLQLGGLSGAVLSGVEGALGGVG